MDTGGTESKLRDYLKRVTAELSHARQRLQELESAEPEPLAIVGMACRLPGGVRSPEQLWRLVDDGADAVAPFPTNRGWELDDNAGYLQEAALLPDVADFDPTVFGITPREALGMDPQQRLMLETSWEALERAGINPRGLAGTNGGVFTGVVDSVYVRGLPEPPEAVKGYQITGTSTAVASGRVAYSLGLEGPAISVDTACSSSLAALHLAMRSLRAGESEMALVGGVAVLPYLMPWEDFNRQGGLAADGRIKPFSAAADGTNWSEGAGVLVVEPLSRARRHGRSVLALLRGSAVNQDGASNGLSAPNDLSQERVIKSALADAKLRGDEVDVVEAHGTGTPLGDPLEAKALLATYGQDRDGGDPLWVGSVKSNLGHSGACAGMTGVIKMVQAIRHGRLPKTLHVDSPTPHVDWTAGAVELVTQARPWPEVNRSPRGAVSSFGISGTNVHVILEGVPDETPARVEPVAATPVPWLISGKNSAALREQAQRLHDHIGDDVNAVDVGFSLAVGRAGFEERATVIAEDLDGYREGLRAIAAGEDSDGVSYGRVNDGKIAFLFTGQGSQRLGMGKRLYDTVPVFTAAFDEVCAEMDIRLRRALREVVFGEDSEALDQTAYTQPALFAVEVALFRLMESWGITPDYLNGHSIGEISAAHAAGVLSLPDACELVAARGRLMQALPTGGAMVALRASEDEVLPWLNDRVDIATINAPGSVVVSGDEDAVLAIADEFDGLGRKTKRLSVSHAFHSPRMDAMLGEFRQVVKGLSYHDPKIPVVSNLTGAVVSGRELCDPEFWVRHVREAVRFVDGARALSAAGVTTFVELGPDGVLSAAAAEGVDDTRARFIATLRPRRDDTWALSAAVAELAVLGSAVDWEAHFAGSQARLTDLPTYAFQRQRFWAENAADNSDVSAVGIDAAGHGLLGSAIAVAGGDEWVFTARLTQRSQSWIPDHAIAGEVLLPGTAFVDMALHAGAVADCPRLEELTLQSPMVIPERGAVRLQLTVGERDEDGQRAVRVYSSPDTDGEREWTAHAVGVVAAATASPSAPPRQWPPAGARRVDVADLYSDLEPLGYQFGPAFRRLRAVWRRDEELFCEVDLAEAQAEEVGRHRVHPVLLDTALHGSLIGRSPMDGGVSIPFSWSGVEVLAGGATTARVSSRITDDGPSTVVLADESGRPVATLDSLVSRVLDATHNPGPRDLIVADWEPVEPRQAPEWTYLPADPSELPDPVPGVVVVRTGDTDGLIDPVAAAHRWLLRWLSEERHAESTLAFAVAADDPVAAAIAGMVRSARGEHPGRFAIIHLGADPDIDAAVSVITGGEPEVRSRRGEVAVPRARRHDARPRLEIPGDEDWRLGVASDGEFAILPSAGDPAPRPGEVRVRVAAAGLNFRDLVMAMDLVSGFEGVIGLEGAGIVCEVGPGVTEFAVGDRVMGLLNEAMAPRAVARAGELAKLPKDWSFAQGASVPLVFLTSWLGLVDLAKARPGERVLIHSATGGLGLAAIQVARHLGAEVFATASPPKQYLLRDMGLDEAHIASTRTVDFCDKFMSTTDGAGVDVVLNTLAGEFTDASLRLMPRGGRFVELGKTDVREPEQVAAAHPGVDYRYFDLNDNLDAVPAAWAGLMELFGAGQLRPVRQRSWPISRAREAVALMGRAHHLGKIVFTIPQGWSAGRPVLVTGGTGTLGALLARHLVTRHGVTDLVLTSRRGPDAAGVPELVSELEAANARVRVIAADVGDRESLRGLLADVPDLGGVVHAAGVVEDALLTDLTARQRDDVLRAKAVAAANLSELTSEYDLERFVLFSSVAGTVGSGGQANYSAANSYLDELARDRRRRGLPAVSIAWGMWQQASGMTGHLGQQELARLSRTGLRPIPDAEGLALFDAAIATDEPAVIATALHHKGLTEQLAAGHLPHVLRLLARDVADTAGTPDDWRYRIEWRRIDTPTGARPGHWTVLVPTGVDDPWVAAATRALAARADTVEVDAADLDRAAAARLLGSARADGGVLSLLSLDERPHDEWADLPRGIVATLALAQAMADDGESRGLWLATRGAVVTGADGDASGYPNQAMTWGLGREISFEQVKQWGGLVDLPADADETAIARLADVVTGESGEDELAIRPSGVYARRMVRAPLSHDTDPRPWQPRGTVLITGGFGGLATHLAKWLAGNGAAHLVLTSRRGPATPGADQVRAELESLGAKVTIAACDMSERDDVRRLLDGIGDEPPLTAVFHTAGIFQPAAPVAAIPPQMLRDTVAGKVSGAHYLDEALRDIDLDAFVLFSSVTGTWAAGGQGAYSAANAALDVLAASRRARGLHATSIAWGSWAGAGMVHDAESGRYMEQLGIIRMDPERAVSEMARALTHDDTNVSVADVDWSTFAPELNTTRPTPLYADLPDAQRALREASRQPLADASVDQLVAASPDDRQAMLRDMVRQHAAAVLLVGSVDDLAETTPFRDMGIDSLTGVELRNRLNKAIGLRLPASMVMDYPDPAALAAAIADQLPQSPTTGGPPEPAPAAADNTLTALLLAAGTAGRLNETRPIVVNMARLREQFTDPADMVLRPAVVTIQDGTPDGPVVMCVPSFIGQPNAFHYQELAKHFPSHWTVLAMSLPGYRAGEPLPSSVDAMVAGLARVARETVGDRRLVLLGHSGGGRIAAAVAARLESDDFEPEALVMLDSPPWDPDINALPRWFARIYEYMSSLGFEMGAEGDESWITAEARYTTFDYEVARVSAPALMVRASEALEGLSYEANGWEVTWHLPHSTVEVPGDHFSMMQAAAAAECARAITSWMAEPSR